MAVDNPHANKLTVHILAAVAQHEREMISERTKAALKAARARGTRLGNPRLDEAAKRGTAALKANARRFAANVLPIIREIEKAGAASLNAIAAKTQRAQRSHGARRQVDACTGRGRASPFRGRRRKRRHVERGHKKKSADSGEGKNSACLGLQDVWPRRGCRGVRIQSVSANRAAQ